MGPTADFRAAEFRSIRAKNVGIRVKDAKEFRQFCITLREPPAMLQIHHLRIYIFRIVGARGALGDRMIQVSRHLDDSVILKVQQCSASWVTQTSITPPNFIHINTSMFKLNNFSKPKAIYNPGKGRSHRCGHTFFNCGVHKIEDTLKNDT